MSSGDDQRGRKRCENPIRSTACSPTFTVNKHSLTEVSSAADKPFTLIHAGIHHSMPFTRLLANSFVRKSPIHFTLFHAFWWIVMSSDAEATWISMRDMSRLSQPFIYGKIRRILWCTSLSFVSTCYQCWRGNLSGIQWFGCLQLFALVPCVMNARKGSLSAE